MMSDGRPDLGGPGPASAAPGEQAPPVIDQAFDAGSLYALREAMAAHAAQAGMSEGRVSDAVLAVHELAANVVRHGAGQGRLRVWRDDGVLRCEVTDDGTALPAARADAEFSPATVWPVEHGHGLWLIRQVADQASLDRGPAGTAAVVSFALEPPGPLVPLGLDRRSEDGATVLAVTGPLDLASAGRFAALVDELMTTAHGPHLVLDLAGLTGWDASGLAAVLTAQGRIDKIPGAAMVLAGLPVALAGRLRDTGLSDRFTLAPGTGEALDLFAPPALPDGASWLC
jgi:anti-anti-sigma factor